MIKIYFNSVSLAETLFWSFFLSSVASIKIYFTAVLLYCVALIVTNIAQNSILFFCPCVSSVSSFFPLQANSDIWLPRWWALILPRQIHWKPLYLSPFTTIKSHLSSTPSLLPLLLSVHVKTQLFVCVRDQYDYSLTKVFFLLFFFSHVQVRISRRRTDIVHVLNLEQSSEVRKIVVTGSSSQERCVGGGRKRGL